MNTLHCGDQGNTNESQGRDYHDQSQAPMRVVPSQPRHNQIVSDVFPAGVSAGTVKRKNGPRARFLPGPRFPTQFFDVRSLPEVQSGRVSRWHLLFVTLQRHPRDDAFHLFDCRPFWVDIVGDFLATPQNNDPVNHLKHVVNIVSDENAGMP